VSTNEYSEIQAKSVDHTVSVLKSVFGAAPFAGAMLCELIGAVVPNQRTERLVKFAQSLEQRISDLEGRDKVAMLDDPTFTELLEEGALQAARAISDERIEELAALLANGIFDSDITYSENRHLLRILGELSDVEVIWLRSLVHQTLGPDPFYDKHENVLEPISGAMGQEQAIYDKSALQGSYKDHLGRLGLAEQQINFDRKTGIPEYDKHTGRPKTRGYKLTTLGRLMLRMLGYDPK